MTKKKMLLATFSVLLVGLAVVYFLFPSVPLTLATQAERRAANFEQRAIDIAGHHIAYLIGGEGDVMGAQYNLGAMYLEGRGVAKDMDAGLELLHKAADQGHANAQKIIDQVSAGS